MDQEHALLLLGVKENATDAEITAAYRRLMQTVHPDVCKGPEAARLTQEAINAREILTTETTPPATITEPIHDDTALQEVVLAVLNAMGSSTQFTSLVTEVIRHLPKTKRETWRDRLIDPSFWRNGQTQACGRSTETGYRRRRRITAKKSRAERQTRNRRTAAATATSPRSGDVNNSPRSSSAQ